MNHFNAGSKCSRSFLCAVGKFHFIRYQNKFIARAKRATIVDVIKTISLNDFTISLTYIKTSFACYYKIIEANHVAI